MSAKDTKPFPDGKPRCGWVSTEQIYLDYHDCEWGVPERDDRALFEKLILDGFQAGLSWITILKKREAFRRAFDGFRPEIIASYNQAKLAALMQDAGIVRNRAKIEGTVKNAHAYLAIKDSGEQFSDFIWQFTGGQVKQNRWRRHGDLPAETKESQAMAKALKARGFGFCGPTIAYAFMQAIGMVNDHLVACHRYRVLAAKPKGPTTRRDIL